MEKANRYKIDKAGIDLIHSFEGCSLKPYLCPEKVPTIGWGNTFYEDGTSVKMTDKPITQERANALFNLILPKFEDGVNRLVTSSINQNQYNALVSFAYNAGTGSVNPPRGLAGSTLLKKVNKDPNDPTIAQEFPRWVNGGIPGLIRRRKAESDLYFKK